MKKEGHGEIHAVAFYVFAAALTQPVSGIRLAAPFGYHYYSLDHLLPLKPPRIGPVTKAYRALARRATLTRPTLLS